MHQPVTQQENGHGALVRDAINALTAELREVMKATGNDSQADMVWLALASWLRNHSMMPVARKLANGQAVTQPVLANGRAYVFNLTRVNNGYPPVHRVTLDRLDDGQAWHVEG